MTDMSSVVLSFSKERIGAVALTTTGTPLIHLATIEESETTVMLSAVTPPNSTTGLYPVSKKLVPVKVISLALEISAF